MEVRGQQNTLTPLLGKNPGTQWKRKQAGPRAGLENLEKRKISHLCQDSNPRSSSPNMLSGSLCALSILKDQCLILLWYELPNFTSNWINI